jgi:hypothetical protein
VITSLYRLLLRAYPASFRAEYEREMVWAFEQQLARSRTRLDRLVLFAGVAVDLVISAGKERASSPGAAMQPIEGRVADMSLQPVYRSSREARLSALTPLWAGIPVMALIPGSLDMLTTKPPDIIGIPAALVFVVVALLWAAFGAFVVWHARYPVVVAIAIAIFAVPASLVLALAPSFFRVMMFVG